MKNYFESGECTADNHSAYHSEMCDDCTNDCEFCLKDDFCLRCEGGECGESCPVDLEELDEAEYTKELKGNDIKDTE
jgi:hypothetical protein